MFGGFPSSFYTEYHKHLPKSAPEEEYDLRSDLYVLFHYLNHTVIFGVSPHLHIACHMANGSFNRGATLVARSRRWISCLTNFRKSEKQVLFNLLSGHNKRSCVLIIEQGIDVRNLWGRSAADVQCAW